MPVLTAIDALGIQRFVFASNRLRDAVGASWQVHRATSRERLRELAPRPVQVLVAAGGNGLLLFPDPEGMRRARRFAAEYSRWLLDETPGLEVALVHLGFEDGRLAGALRDVQVRMAKRKTELVPSAPLGGLGVTADCRETGRPATGLDPRDPTRPLSATTRSVRAGLDDAAALWDSFLDAANTALEAGVAGRLAFPLEMEEFRSSGKLSMLGVVHLDGNAVGRRIAGWVRRCEEQGLPDAEVASQCQEWSTALDDAGAAALTEVSRRAAASLRLDPVGGALRVQGTEPDLVFPVPMKDGKHLLPLRPVLLGGDDLTFLADGRIALDLATAGLDAFERAEVPHLTPPPLRACAGVALVGTHAPVLRAYQLAEQLCRSAKRFARQAHDGVSALDWHVGAVRPGERLTRLRARQYQADGRDLTCRPYPLREHPTGGVTWRWLATELLGQGPRGSLRGPVWREHRGKVKELAALAREGPETLQPALAAWRSVQQELAAPGGLDNGYLGGQTPLLDAVELVDLHLALDPPAAEPGSPR